ncbi:unnamed protein product [Clonostachys chloroleuca]|uniref:Uncharacterized protein n=1 Tax=Clonostachys chloroleuca TaxID=1926264 RepID=A0AA35LV49_9HYPO|nr:unnamed protein product [Clonostachys chloroleuca]
MVAIKQAISALPLLLAIASQVDSDNLEVRAEVNNDDALQLRGEEMMLEERGNSKSKIDKSKIGKPTNPKGTHPITMPDKDLKFSKKRPVSTTSSNGDPFYLEKYVKKGKRDFDYDYYFA